MDIASAVKELIGLGLEIQKSIVKVRCNKETTTRLSNEIARDLDELESLLSGYSFHPGDELYAALDVVKQEMIAVHKECEKLIPKANKTKVLAVPKAKFRAWRKRDDIEAELVQMKSHVHNCLSKFTAYSTARIERTSHRMEYALVGHIVENRVQSQRLGGLLETYLISTPAGAQIVQQFASIACNDHSHATIEYQYLHVLVTRLQDFIGSNASSRGYNSVDASHDAEFDLPYEMPNEHHSHCLELQRVRRQEPETVIFHILDILKEYKEFGNTIQIQDSASSLGELANYLHFLHSPQSDKLHAWAIKIYRSLARREPTFFPFLALCLSNSGDFHAKQEAYTICTTIHNIQPALHSPELYLWSTNRYIFYLIQQEQFSDALPIAQIAMEQVGCSLWASSLTQLALWKQGDPWSPQIQHHLENAGMVCEGLSNLMICLTRTGDPEAAFTVAQQCLDILAELPHPIRDLNPSPDSTAHFPNRSIRCAENRALVCLSRQLREIGHLEEAYNLVKKSFQPTITTPWDSQGSFQETLQILCAMHSTQLLRFSQLEALIHVLHSNFKHECSEMIDIYLMLCLECDKDIANSDIITCNASEIWNAFIVDSSSEPISVHPYCISVQLSTFLSINMDIVWDCIDHMIYTSGAIIHAFFTNDYKGSVAAMMTRVVKPESISTVAAKVVRELKQASIPLEPSMIEQVLTVCSGIISALKSSSEPNTHHDPTNKHNEYIHTVLAYCSILDDCGYPQDALEHAEQLAKTGQMSPFDAMHVHTLRTSILKELMRYKEGVSAALDLVGAWEQLHCEGPGTIWGPNLGGALDLLSEMLTAAGDAKGAAEARAKADTVWEENKECIGARQLPELLQASITEVLDDKSTTSSSDTDQQLSPVDNSSPTILEALESKPLPITGPIPTTVAQLPVCEDITPNDIIDSPSSVSEAPEKPTLEEPIIILKITPSCINATLAWGAFYLVALIVLLMIAWQSRA